MKELIVQAIEKELRETATPKGKRLKLPLVRLPHGTKVDLTGFDFDDLLT